MGSHKEGFWVCVLLAFAAKQVADYPWLIELKLKNMIHFAEIIVQIRSSFASHRREGLVSAWVISNLFADMDYGFALATMAFGDQPSRIDWNVFSKSQYNVCGKALHYAHNVLPMP